MISAKLIDIVLRRDVRFIVVCLISGNYVSTMCICDSMCLCPFGPPEVVAVPIITTQQFSVPDWCLSKWKCWFASFCAMVQPPLVGKTSYLYWVYSLISVGPIAILFAEIHFFSLWPSFFFPVAFADELPPDFFFPEILSFRICIWLKHGDISKLAILNR